MSNGTITTESIPQPVYDRLYFLRSQWRKNKKTFDRTRQNFSQLKQLIYLLVVDDKVPQNEIADMLPVKPQRITAILEEIKKERGDQHE